MTGKLGLLALVAGFTLAAGIPAATAQAQGRQPIVTQGAKSRGAGPDQNIKTRDVTNRKEEQTIPAPPRKGGAKTRGAPVATLHVDNSTPLYVDIYVDGDYRGTLAPWGDWYADGQCNAYVLYAVARFDDGSKVTWGPTTTASGCTDQTWTLKP